MKYRKKPIVVNAFKYLEDEVPIWFREAKGITISVDTMCAYIPTLEGIFKVSFGDYIIQGIRGEIYPCKPDIFDETYELVFFEEIKK